MKIKEGFVLRKMAGQYVGLYAGSDKDGLDGMVQMNDMGAFLWQILEKDCSREQLLSAVLETYSVDKTTAAADIDKILSILEENNILV